MENLVKVKNAIISVSDKTGLVELAKELDQMGVSIYSTGGTAKALENVGIPVIKISNYTGFPEILDGRVKSLHPKIHGGILARRDNENHMEQLHDNDIVPFDLVVINLYPFEKVIQKKDFTVEEAIENIDIGGPSMLRSSAKNYKFVCVVSDPMYYELIIDEIKQKGGISLNTREKLAMVVFEKTAYYDSIIASFFHSKIVMKEEDIFPNTISFYFQKKQALRYGENPHQKAAFYTNPEIKVTGVASAKKLHGKELSFNNILDIESAFEIVKEFDEPQSFLDAWDSDPVSAFGSIIGLNKEVDEETALKINEAGFVECVIAPSFSEKALGILTQKKNLRLLETGKIRKGEIYDYDMKRIIGGVLIQERDLMDMDSSNLKVVTEKSVSEDDLKSLLFGWKIVKHVKSNAIVIVQGTKTVGVGAGQMSRVDSTFMAIKKAGGREKGGYLASDAFFPHPDAVELAAEHGIKAIIQPGGSIKDQDIIDACNKHGIAMVFTGIRHFKH